MTIVRNSPTPEGRSLGAELARLVEAGIQKIWKEDGQPDDRCASCAFRAGTLPNGSPVTTMDALKAAMEGSPFLCHMEKPPTKPCHGWYAARVALDGATRTMPWDFSTDPEKAE
jgi:hypothetical protein